MADWIQRCDPPLLGMIAVIQVFVYPNAWTEHLGPVVDIGVPASEGRGQSLGHHFVDRYLATLERHEEREVLTR